MPQYDLICLANSRKHGGRCVAGLRCDGGGWLRLVGPPADGTLHQLDYMLDDLTEAGVLDVIRVGIHAPRPALHQPENAVTDGTRWTLLARPLGTHLLPVLRRAIIPGPELIQGFSDRVSLASLQQQPAPISLALLAPESLHLYQKLTYWNKPQARGRFSLGISRQAIFYDLAITDQQWEAHVLRQGTCTLRQLDAKFLVVISLGEPLDSYCYKLIAAIILLPLHLATVF
jgi:hypothetical protein